MQDFDFEEFRGTPKGAKKQFNPGKIKPLVQLVLGIIKHHPNEVDNPDYVMACLRAQVPDLQDPGKCANCDASMVEYIFKFDCFNALLLVEMAKQVARNREKGQDFTISNQVHVPTLPTSHAIRCRSTQCAKLGLIAMLKNVKGRHVPGVWSITRRGWAALRGEPVPAWIVSWRGRIEERTSETITVGQAMKAYRDRVQMLIEKHKTPKSDYREFVDAYDPMEWVNFGQLHEAKLL